MIFISGLFSDISLHLSFFVSNLHCNLLLAGSAFTCLILAPGTGFPLSADFFPDLPGRFIEPASHVQGQGRQVYVCVNCWAAR